MKLKARLFRIAVVAGLGYLFFSFLLLPVRSAPSALEKSSLGFNFINRSAYLFSPPKRWDTIAIRTSGTSLVYLKKILALPNESLLVLGRSPFIDSKAIDVPVDPETIPYNMGEAVLADDEYFVIPISPEEEPGFTSFGIVKKDRIVGEVLF